MPATDSAAHPSLTRRASRAALAAALGAAALVTSAPAHADSHTHITPQQCAEAHSAAAAGDPLPTPQLLRFPDRRTSVVDGVLRIHVDPAVDKDVERSVHRAAEEWERAGKGKVRIEFAQKRTPETVEFTVAKPGDGDGKAGGTRNIGKEGATIRLSESIAQGCQDSREYVIAHELGHALGLAHGCAKDLMKAADTPGKISVRPTPTDVAGLLQDNPVFD